VAVKSLVVAVSVLFRVKQSDNNVTCNNKECLKEFQQIFYKTSPQDCNSRTIFHRVGNSLRSNQVNSPTK
jgi:hypothetical protein